MRRKKSNPYLCISVATGSARPLALSLCGFKPLLFGDS